MIQESSHAFAQITNLPEICAKDAKLIGIVL